MPTETEKATPEGEDAEVSEDEPEQKWTYGAMRSDLLSKFLKRADKVIEIEQNKANAKAETK